MIAPLIPQMWRGKTIERRCVEVIEYIRWKLDSTCNVYHEVVEETFAELNPCVLTCKFRHWILFDCLALDLGTSLLMRFRPVVGFVSPRTIIPATISGLVASGQALPLHSTRRRIACVSSDWAYCSLAVCKYFRLPAHGTLQRLNEYSATRPCALSSSSYPPTIRMTSFKSLIFPRAAAAEKLWLSDLGKVSRPHSPASQDAIAVICNWDVGMPWKSPHTWTSPNAHRW